MPDEQTDGPDQQAPPEPLSIAMTGATGLLGSALTSYFRGHEHRVVPLVRAEEKADGEAIYWSVEDQQLDPRHLEGFDVVIHLAGENIFGRWTEAKKRRIMESRRKGTELLTDALVKLDDPPQTYISASGVDYYGPRGDEVVDEEDLAGEGFLAEVCQVWEEATDPARQAGIRTVNMRTAMVLSREGGALGMMLTPFKLGLGGRLGPGDQYMSWIAVTDYVRGVDHIVETDELEGPVNMASPNPVRNREFTEILGDVLHRPTVIPVPKFAMKVAFGEMADNMLLSGQRVDPKRLRETGFEWDYPDLPEALRAELGE